MIKKLFANLYGSINVVLVLMIFVGIFTYDRSIELSNYSSLELGLLLFGKFAGYFGALIAFYQLSQNTNLSKLFVVTIVLFCQGGIIFWIFDSLIIKIISYMIIGFSFNLTRLTSISLLKTMNAQRFSITIMSGAGLIAFLVANIPEEKRILVILFISISSIMPYILGSHDIHSYKTKESNLNWQVIVICFRYYGKFFWNIICSYLGDILFISFFIPRLRLVGMSSYLTSIYFIAMMSCKMLLHYPVQIVLKRFDPNTKCVIVSSIVCILCILHLIFYENLIISLITNCGIGLFGSFFQFSSEYLDKYKNIKHTFLPTTLLTNLIYVTVSLVAVPLGTYANVLSPKWGIDYLILLTNIICIINSIM
jgi:hypothetical protein